MTLDPSWQWNIIVKFIARIVIDHQLRLLTSHGPLNQTQSSQPMIHDAWIQADACRPVCWRIRVLAGVVEFFREQD